MTVLLLTVLTVAGVAGGVCCGILVARHLADALLCRW